MAQDRATFQQLARLRLEEAKILFTNGQSSGAYYLAGYAIECALKARLAAEFRSDEIPDLKRVQNIHTHDLAMLLSLVGLKAELEAERGSNPDLYERWTVIREWSEKARYEVWTQDSASAIMDAAAAMKDFCGGCRIVGRGETRRFEDFVAGVDRAGIVAAGVLLGFHRGC